MNGKRILVSVLCFILILTASIIPTLLTVGATSGGYDYSKPGSYFNTSFTSADLLEYVGIDITEGERAYLEKYGSFNVRYECVTTQQITVVNADDLTKIIASPYTYTSVSGEELTWTPVSISVDGVEGDMTPDGGSFVASFDSSLVNEDSAVDVEYVLKGVNVSVSASDINEMLNLAYLNAPSVKEKFDKIKSDYEASKNAYDSFYSENRTAVDKYYFDKEQYAKYLRDKLVYNEKYGVYKDYLSELEKYETALSLYNEYLEDLDEYNAIIENNLNYEENLAQYKIDKAKYDEYLPKINTAREQIAVIDNGLMSKVTHLDRQLYSAFFSGLVDKVVNNRELFVTVLGIDSGIIDGCAEASDDIRAILAPKRGVSYKSLKTEEEKYDFYVSNHAALRDAVIKLTRSLLELYSYDIIRSTMHNPPQLPGEKKSEDYTEKFAIFISQLILFSNALSDEPVMDYNNKFVLDKNVKLSYWDADGNPMENLTVMEILEGNEFVLDSGNSSPIAGGYPDEVKEPTEPHFVDPLPEKPAEVARPIAPVEVEDPGEAPEVVSAPTPPVGFTEEPEKPEMLDDPAYVLLTADYNSGVLKEREEVSEGISYTPTVTLSKRIHSADAVTVTFTDGKGGVISEVSVDKGTSANFIGELPTKAEDVSATYTFLAWADEDGNIFDLSHINDNATLYPLFSPSYKSYDIEYNVNGTGENLIKISDPDISLEHLPITRFAEIANEHLAGLYIVAGNAAVKLPYSSLVEISEAGVSYLDVKIDTSVEGAYSFEFSAMDKKGEQVNISSRIDVEIPCADPIFANQAILTYGDQSNRVNKSYKNGKIYFTGNTNYVYSLSVRYNINLYSSVSEYVSSQNDSIPGQLVELEINIPKGTVLDIYYTLSSNSSVKYKIEGSSFVMPAEDINIGGKLTYLEYTVKFINDGKEISSKTYKYGDTVRIPNPPVKLNDGEYSYEFIGWSAEVTTVTGDATYVAVFERTPLPKEESKFPWFSVLYYSAITVFVLGAVTIVIVILNKKGVINVKGILLTLKRKLSRVGGKIEDENTSELLLDAKNESESQKSESDAEENGQ